MQLDAGFEHQLHAEFERRVTNNDLPREFTDELANYQEAQVIGVSRSLYDATDHRQVVVNTELEHVVLAFKRPSLLVRNGVIESATSEHWRNILDTHAVSLTQAVSGVGRIELKNHGQLAWSGTGFLVAPNLIVTNRHVALDFVQRQGSEVTWRVNEHSGKYITGRIDFLEEYRLPGENEFVFDSVQYLAGDSEPDVALLKLASSPDVEPLSLSSAINPDAMIVTIGYPWRDSRVSSDLEAIHRRIFNDIYDVKRAAPGKVLSVSGTEMAHDCSTLGGNSGSACIDIETGEVVGVHYGGEYVHNVAVAADYLRVLIG